MSYHHCQNCLGGRKLCANCGARKPGPERTPGGRFFRECKRCNVRGPSRPCPGHTDGARTTKCFESFAACDCCRVHAVGFLGVDRMKAIGWTRVAYLDGKHGEFCETCSKRWRELASVAFDQLLGERANKFRDDITGPARAAA